MQNITPYNTFFLLNTSRFVYRLPIESFVFYKESSQSCLFNKMQIISTTKEYKNTRIPVETISSPTVSGFWTVTSADKFKFINATQKYLIKKFQKMKFITFCNTTFNFLAKFNFLAIKMHPTKTRIKTIAKAINPSLDSRLFS